MRSGRKVPGGLAFAARLAPGRAGGRPREATGTGAESSMRPPHIGPGWTPLNALAWVAWATVPPMKTDPSSEPLAPLLEAAITRFEKVCADRNRPEGDVAVAAQTVVNLHQAILNARFPK